MKKIFVLIVLMFLSIWWVKAVDENIDLIDKYYIDQLNYVKNTGTQKNFIQDISYFIEFDYRFPFNSVYRLDADIWTCGGMCGLPGDWWTENIKYTNKIGEIYKTFMKRYLVILEKTLKDDGNLTDEIKTKIDKLSIDIEDSRMNTYKFVYQDYGKKPPKIINWFHLNWLEACNAVQSEIMKHIDLHNSFFFSKSYWDVWSFHISKLIADLNQANITNTGVFYSNTMSWNILVLSNKQKITQKFSDYSWIILNIKNSKWSQVDRFFLFPFKAINENWPINVEYGIWSLQSVPTVFDKEYPEINKRPIIDINNFFTIKEKIEMYQLGMNERNNNTYWKFSIVKIQWKYFLLARKVDIR